MASSTNSLWSKHQRKSAVLIIVFLLFSLMIMMPANEFLGLAINAKAETKTGMYGNFKYEIQGGCVIISSDHLKNYDLFTGIIEIPAEIDGLPVKGIGEYTFQNQYDLIEVIIPDSVTSIGDNAFYNCRSLTSITIPDSVTSIGDSAFFECSSLTSITIPDSVTSIGQSVFALCDSLSSITIPTSVKSLGGLGVSESKSLREITIGCPQIPEGTFKGCQNLKEVHILDGVKSIGYSAFANCISLTEITIPDSVISIGNGAFSGCTNLSTVTIPDSVTELGIEVFDKSTKVKGNNSKYLKEKWKSIGISVAEYVFGGLVAVLVPVGLAFLFMGGGGGSVEQRTTTRSPVEKYVSNSSALDGNDMFYDPVRGKYVSVDSDGTFRDEHGVQRKIIERGDGWIKDEYGRTHYSSIGRFKNGNYTDIRDDEYWNNDD